MKEEASIPQGCAVLGTVIGLVVVVDLVAGVVIWFAASFLWRIV